MADENDRRPELRQHEPHWYDQWAADLSEKMGDTPETMRWAKKLTGPENPLNAPAWITEGVDHARTGWKTRNYPQVLFGGLEATAGALPFAGGAASLFQRLARQRAARHAAEAAKGPWGNERMLDEMLDSRPPQVARNPINLPKMREEIQAYDNGLPHYILDGPLTDAQKAENFAKGQKIGQLRNAYDEMAGGKFSYGRDLHNDKRQQRMMTAEELRAEYDNLINSADAIMKREKQADLQYDPINDKWYGVEGDAKSGYNRPWYPNEQEQLENYRRNRSRQNMHIEGPSPEEGLRADLQRFAANNEHNPYLMQQADRLAEKVDGINQQQQPHWDRISRERKAWNDVLFGNNRIGTVSGDHYDSGIQYYRDVDQFMKDAQKAGRPYTVHRGHDAEMDLQEFQQLLNMDPRARHVAERPELAKQIYDDFWRNEYELMAQGKPTNHDLYMQRVKLAQEQDVREMGLNPRTATQEEIDAAYQKKIDELRGQITEHKKRLGLIPDDDKFLDAVFPRQADKIRAFGNNVFRYGPPTAVGAYAANRALNWPEAKRINSSPEEKPAQPPERSPETPKAAPIKYDPTGLPADADSDAYLKYAVSREADAANRDRQFANFRLVAHGIFGPLATFAMPGKVGKTAMGTYQAASVASALADRRRALGDMETYDAQKKGYIDQLPNLNRDEYLD